MWRYEDSHETPTHDVLTIISFLLFSVLLFWEGISLVSIVWKFACSLFSERIVVLFLRIVKNLHPLLYSVLFVEIIFGRYLDQIGN